MRPQCRQGYPPQCPGRLRGPGCLPATRPDRPGLSTRECSCACPPHLWGGAALRDAHLPPHPPQHRTVAVILGAVLSTPRARRAQRPEWAKSSQHFGCQLSARRSSGVHGARPRDSKSTSWVLFEYRENGERHLDRALGLLIAEQLPWHEHLLGVIPPQAVRRAAASVHGSKSARSRAIVHAVLNVEGLLCRSAIPRP